ncbi:hypothetical protein CJU90_1424 [Yarrowia sp. C11]|nr:hypothetical protein CKK34_0148 [Yarrowia sp. E02]KAG5371395.1 hypothetical protein CJU90_1424 [Yarrowia sp. C11]
MKIQSVFFFSLAAIAAAFEAGIADADNIPVPTPIEPSEEDFVDGPLITGESFIDEATNEYEYTEGDFEGNTSEELADYFKQDYQGDAENPEDIHKLIEHIKEKKCPKKKCLNKIVKTKTCYVTLHKLHFKTVKKSCPAPTKHVKKPIKKQPTKKQPTKKERCPDCGSTDCGGGNQCPNKGNKGKKNQKSKEERCPDCGSNNCDGGSSCPDKKNNNKSQRCPNCGDTDCGGCSGKNHNQCPNCGSRNCGGDC